MLNRRRLLGENFSNPGMVTVSLIYDGTNRQYVCLGDKWYLLRYVSDETKNELVSHRLPQIDYLRGLVECHGDTANHLQQNVTDDTTEFQHIVIFHHVSIAFFLKDAFSLLEMGSLASSLTLLRSAIEIMIEIQYLQRHPSEVATYDEKVEKHNKQTQTEGKPIERRRNLRFKKIGELMKTLRKSGDLSELEDALIGKWDLLSGLASHVTPELHTIAQAKPEWAWKTAFGELEQVTGNAIDQVRGVDQELGRLIAQEEELKLEERLRNLFSYGTSTSPED